METTFKKSIEMQFKHLNDAKYKQSLGFPLTAYEQNILGIFGDQFDKANGNVDDFVKSVLPKSQYDKKLDPYKEMRIHKNNGTVQTYTYYEGATDLPKDFVDKTVKNWKSKGGEKALSMFKSAVDYIRNINSNQNNSITPNEMKEINDSIATGMAIEVPVNIQQTPIATKQPSKIDVKPIQSTAKDIPTIVKAAAQRVVRAWDDKETQKISEVSGIPMNTQERVALGKEIFGTNEPYRGTQVQNAKLAEVLKNRAMNQMKPTHEPQPRNMKTSDDWTNWL